MSFFLLPFLVDNRRGKQEPDVPAKVGGDVQLYSLNAQRRRGMDGDREAFPQECHRCRRCSPPLRREQRRLIIPPGEKQTLAAHLRRGSFPGSRRAASTSKPTPWLNLRGRPKGRGRGGATAKSAAKDDLSHAEADCYATVLAPSSPSAGAERDDMGWVSGGFTISPTTSQLVTGPHSNHAPLMMFSIT